MSSSSPTTTSTSKEEGCPLILLPQPSEERVEQLLSEHPIPDNGQYRYSYGTAGFRLRADLLPCVMVRIGILAAIRSASFATDGQRNGDGDADEDPTATGAAVGVMVTASHNDETYNGAKIADPDGGMMDGDGESLAVRFANDPRTPSELVRWIFHDTQLKSVTSSAAPPATAPPAPVIHIGRDTRSHSLRLSQLVVDAARACGAIVYDHGEITTPCLHHCVLHYNTRYLPPHLRQDTGPATAESYANESGYYDLLANSYTGLIRTKETDGSSNAAIFPTNTLLVDCACGIGYLALRQLVYVLQQIKCMRRIVATNRPTSGPLNVNCGSEHIQKSLQPPTFYNIPPVSKQYCAAFDGDADRIVFFSLLLDEENSENTKDETAVKSMILLDGDKIACLFCEFIQQQFSEIQKCVAGRREDPLPSLKVGVVQTAYANGASTEYLKQQVFGGDTTTSTATTTMSNQESSQQHPHVMIAKTGVKHVHKVAHDHFDVGIYFEANGHGTILFGPRFYHYLDCATKVLESFEDSSCSSKAAAVVALQRLKLTAQLINPTVGDALSDLLLVDAILHLSDKYTSLQDWDRMYTDLPSKQVKVKVHDRTVIRTNDNETQCLQPDGVQDALRQAMDELTLPDGTTRDTNARVFIRPSGTEDVVRVYAEASTRVNADLLGQKAVDIVNELCGGIASTPGEDSKEHQHQQSKM